MTVAVAVAEIVNEEPSCTTRRMSVGSASTDDDDGILYSVQQCGNVPPVEGYS